MARLTAIKPMLSGVGGMVRPVSKVADPFYVSDAWKRLVRRIKRERGDRCCRCGSGHRVAGDHIVEIRDGGARLDASNVQLLCAGCHNRKTAAARRARSGL